VFLYPTPELPDDTLIEDVRFSARVRKALNAAGLKTVGEVREASDAALLSLPDFGRGSLYYIRGALGLPSVDGVRPLDLPSPHGRLSRSLRNHAGRSTRGYRPSGPYQLLDFVVDKTWVTNRESVS
jgi:hypothetical protein